MDKDAVLGELLYIISNYEKSRIPVSKFWKKIYIKSLRESIEIMELLLLLIEKEGDISVKEMVPFFDYYKRSKCPQFRLIGVDLKELMQDTSRILLVGNATHSEINIVIINFMKKIIIECNFLIKNKERGYKLKIYYLLAAFHNLPRAFIDTTKETLFNNGTRPISSEEAIEYSLSYIKIMYDKGRATKGTEEMLRYVSTYVDNK